MSPRGQDIERLILLYWYLPIHQTYLTFDKLDSRLSGDIWDIKISSGDAREENGKEFSRKWDRKIIEVIFSGVLPIWKTIHR